MDAPALSRRATTGAVRVLGGCVARQRGCPNEDVCPAMDIRSLTAAAVPVSGPSPVGGRLNESGTQQLTAMSAPPTLPLLGVAGLVPRGHGSRGNSGAEVQCCASGWEAT